MNVIILELCYSTFIFNILFVNILFSVANMSTHSLDIREEKSKLRLEIKNKLKNMSDTDKIKQSYTISMRVSLMYNSNLYMLSLFYIILKFRHVIFQLKASCLLLFKKNYSLIHFTKD